MTECLLCGGNVQIRSCYLTLFSLVKQTNPVCIDCKNQFIPTIKGGCTRCQKSCQENVCPDCKRWEEQGEIVHHRSLYRYNSAMSEFFTAYKFRGDYRLREIFAQDLQQALREYKDHLIIPIPLSPNRLAERGFNQVTALLDAAAISYEEWLTKKEMNKQSERSRIERLHVQQPFSYIENCPQNKRILLVDDVYTTGATLHLAKQVLMKTNPKEITTFSLAR